MRRLTGRETSAMAAAAAVVVGRREVYQASTQSAPSSWKEYWRGENEKPVYPDARSPHPLKQINMRKTRTEWTIHHGNGKRMGMYGPLRDVADWEYADGTPSPTSKRRHAYMFHLDHTVVQMIRAGAAVERLADAGALPKVPATREQRAWDPQIPLFLEDEDEHGTPPVQKSGSGRLSQMTSKFIESKYTQDRTSSELVDKDSDEKLEPITMFANYNPESFISENFKDDARRPHWSKRKWSLTQDFIVNHKPRGTNSVPDK